MSWAGWAVAPGAQVSFVPLIRLVRKGKKKEGFFVVFHFLKLSASHPQRDKLPCSPCADVGLVRPQVELHGRS